MNDGAGCMVVLSLQGSEEGEEIRLRRLVSAGQDQLEIRAWRPAEWGWTPGVGLTLPFEKLPELQQALMTVADLLCRGPEPAMALADSRERARRLARQVARARERLESLRLEDFQRPQDYRRLRTIRLLDLRRAEKSLGEAEAALALGLLHDERGCAPPPGGSFDHDADNVPGAAPP